MNAAQDKLNARSPRESDLAVPAEMLSALVDGEVDTTQLHGLFAAEESSAEILGNWHAYQLIGEVLRGSGEVVATRSPDDFLAGLRQHLRSESSPVAPRLEPVVLDRPAAALVRTSVANDAVFRWKLVAGVASLAAVMAVSWTVLGGAPAGVQGSGGAQLALTPAPTETQAPAVAVNEVLPSNAVVVSTGQGTLIRDARLEELLAEHRQNGSMSALQMPTGFIRNATYDAAGR